MGKNGLQTGTLYPTMVFTLFSFLRATPMAKWKFPGLMVELEP